MSDYPQIRDFGDTGFGVAFGDGIDRAVNAQVMALHAAIGAADLPGVIETIPSFGTLFVQYDPLLTGRADLEKAVRGMLPRLQAKAHQGRLWRIPVCYEGDLAPDLAEVAERCKLSPEAVVARHQAGTFFIYMLGFMPGLAYMGGLDETLQLPRRSSPRLKVPAGSVAIAETMTTIYPWESPGGWHLIGRTPVRLFDAARAAPILYGAGDEVRFERISRGDYDALETAIMAGGFDHAALEIAQ